MFFMFHILWDKECLFFEVAVKVKSCVASQVSLIPQKTCTFACKYKKSSLIEREELCLVIFHKLHWICTVQLTDHLKRKEYNIYSENPFAFFVITFFKVMLKISPWKMKYLWDEALNVCCWSRQMLCMLSIKLKSARILCCYVRVVANWVFEQWCEWLKRAGNYQICRIIFWFLTKHSSFLYCEMFFHRYQTVHHAVVSTLYVLKYQQE